MNPSFLSSASLSFAPDSAVSRFLSETDSPRSQILQISQPDKEGLLLHAVRKGLYRNTGRQLPSMYLYDELGSALFEEITGLPEYYPTRLEKEILRSRSSELMNLLAGEEDRELQIIELGSGSAVKTTLLMDAWERLTLGKLTYIPIDISLSALQGSIEELSDRYPACRFLGLAGTYEECLAALPTAASEQRLFLFLGGTMGNFMPKEQERFFQTLAQHMAPGHLLLLGFDHRPHPDKSIDAIERAYNDSQGVTARFNLNLLTRLNRELKANFYIQNWRHQAFYNQDLHQIEMHLESSCKQTITIPGLDDIDFQAQETIHTEVSRRYDPEALANWFQERGFRSLRRWTDASGYFGLMLLSRTTC